MRLHLFQPTCLAAIAVAFAVPAQAQEWYARESPLMPQSGQDAAMCHLSSGEEPPIVFFTFEKERTRFAVIAEEFRSRDDIAEYSGTLPSGASVTMTLGANPDLGAAVLDLADREVGLSLVDHFRIEGEFGLSGSGVQIAIPALPSANHSIARLLKCLEALG
ncbi:hypothetical protein [Pelagibacterium montanilacus]|uniref:hypothetical protein n=1 Tax=Pelagibacterium montanilacus TaxID=2185280 RepID=UPI000F8E301E|nr:hypothetical protein [Pelagibacterium montanilacus]